MHKKPAKKKAKVHKKPAKKKAAPKPTKPHVFTLKQEAFITWYCSAEIAGKGTESARRAGYTGTDNGLAVIASENLRKPHIKAEIDRRMAVFMTGAHVTVETVLTDLEIIKARALAAGKFAPAATCAVAQGKYLKMFSERIELVQTIDDVTDEQLVNLMRELSQAAGIDLIDLLATITQDGSENSTFLGPSGVSKPH